eukprot:IDg3242t1
MLATQVTSDVMYAMYFCFGRSLLSIKATQTAVHDRALQRTVVVAFPLRLAENAVVERQILDKWIVSLGQVVTTCELEIMQST